MEHPYLFFMGSASLVVFAMVCTYLSLARSRRTLGEIRQRGIACTARIAVEQRAIRKHPSLPSRHYLYQVTLAWQGESRVVWLKGWPTESLGRPGDAIEVLCHSPDNTRYIVAMPRHYCEDEALEAMADSLGTAAVLGVFYLLLCWFAVRGG